MSPADTAITATLANPEEGLVALVYPDGTMHTVSVPESESILLLGHREDFSIYVTSHLPEHSFPGVILSYRDRHLEVPAGIAYQITDVIPSRSERFFGFHLFGWGICLYDVENRRFLPLRAQGSMLSAEILEDGAVLIHRVEDSSVTTLMAHSEKPFPPEGLSRLLGGEEPPMPQVPEGARGYVHTIRNDMVQARNPDVPKRGHAVVFSGGPISSHSALYDPLVDSLTSAGYWTFLPAYPCSPGTLEPRSPRGDFREMATEVISRIRDISLPEGEELVLAGRSFGAWAALLAPSQGLVPRRILALSPPVSISASLTKQESHAEIDYLDALVVISGIRPPVQLSEAYALVESQDISRVELDHLAGVETTIALNSPDPVTAFSGWRSQALEELSSVAILRSENEGHATDDLVRSLVL